MGVFRNLAATYVSDNLCIVGWDPSIDKDLAFDAIVQGMKALGWLERPEKRKKSRKDQAFGAIFEGMKTLGWDADIQEAAIKNSGQTIEEIEAKDQETINSILQKSLKPLFLRLRRSQNNFKILILGQIECEKNDIEELLYRYLHNLNLSQNEWQVDYCIKTRAIKKYDVRKLKLAQSGYSLVASANIPQHQTKGNNKGNIISTLSQPGYIPFIKICHPKKKPTAEQITNKLEEYFLEKIEQIRKPNIVDYMRKKGH